MITLSDLILKALTSNTSYCERCSRDLKILCEEKDLYCREYIESSIKEKEHE